MKQEKKNLVVLLVFVALAAIVITVGICVLQVPVVPLCALVIVEAGIAVMLHHAELWVHAVVVVIELIAGAVSGKLVLAVLCALVYAAATAVLIVSEEGERANG